MALPEIAHRVIEVVQLIWQPVATVVMLWALWATYRKTRLMWQRRTFLTRINFSLNYVEGRTLKIRTLREDDLGEILLGNQHGKKVVLKAARRTTLPRPFLELPKDDAWTVLNAVLNELSEQFAQGLLVRSVKGAAAPVWFVFGLTCEKHPAVRMNKLRVMVIERSLLEKIDRLEGLVFEQRTHHVRLDTLREMRAVQLDPARRHNLMEVELPAG